MPSKKRFFLPLLILIFIISACSQATPPPKLTSTPAATTTATTTAGVPVTAVTPTATIAQATLPPSTDTLKAGNSCTLLNSSDLAHLFPPHNEITRDVPKTAQVTHPPFSSANAPGTEKTCLFYDFHQPGVQTGWMLQIIYLVDTPAPSSEAAWAQAWDAAKAQSGQTVSSLGDEAFTSGTRLYIKKGSAYLTFDATDTHLDAKTASGIQQLLAYETQLAAAALSRLK